ncbi:hypothetical protein M405DRAFT_858487 [Rhizopogon salebrosus TDB-379]|nr:hypothetical protein M405DRAFT_858487 [Rhizopogon salebrosus TDB-379]
MQVGGPGGSRESAGDVDDQEEEGEKAEETAEEKEAEEEKPAEEPAQEGAPAAAEEGTEFDTYHTTPNRHAQGAKPHRLLAVVKLATFACLASWVCGFALPRLVTPTLLSKHSGVLRDDPASGFADDDFPLRAHESWDISTDFSYPRTLSYQVTEGTWLRLDVHPVSGDIVFDMAGDVYCLPLTRIWELLDRWTGGRKRLAFKSDAGLGIDNLCVSPWAADGCGAMDVREHINPSRVLEQKQDEELLAQGVKETDERKLRRLTREGRVHAQRITNETYSWVSDPRWHPSGDMAVATKWYFSSLSLGAGEGWEFPVPAVNAKSLVEAGAGKRLVSKRLPMGWTKADYVEQQCLPSLFNRDLNTGTCVI